MHTETATSTKNGFIRKNQLTSNDQIYLASMEARRARAKVAKLREPNSEEHVVLEGKGPHTILFLNDIHFGSDTVDYDLLDEVVAFVENNPNVYVICLGDMIEGYKPQYTGLVNHRIGNVREDIVDFQHAVLEKIGSRIIAAVGHFFGHTGWAQDQSGGDPWQEIFSDYGIPVVKNSSAVHLEYQDQDGKTISTQIDVAHYFQGKSQVDFLHSQRKHWTKKKGVKKPHAAASGHTHQAAMGAELYPGAPYPAILVQSGAFKGVNPNLPADDFASKGAFDTSVGEPGQMLILTSGGARYRAINPTQGAIIHAAMDWWDNHNRLAEEAIHTANQQSKPIVRQIPRRSVVSDDQETILTREQQEERLQALSADDEETGESLEINGKIYSPKDLSPLHDIASFDVRSDWPILFLPIANVRLGSSYEGLETLQTMYRDFIEKNPHVLMAFLGNVIDTEVAKKETRIETLDVLAELINTIGTERVLALLLDSSMRNANWRKQVGELDYVPPGTYVSEKTGVPLLAGGSSIELFHGHQLRLGRKARHSIMMLDGLRRHGSFSKALMGLTGYDNLFNHAAHDVLVSGHHPHAAVGTYQKDGRYVDLIDVGWLSPYDNTSGKKNVQRTARGGQGLIIHKDMRIPTADWNESVELFQAILALTAARKFDMLR